MGTELDTEMPRLPGTGTWRPPEARREAWPVHSREGDADTSARFLSRLRAAYPEWTIVADLRGGRWVAANGVAQIRRAEGTELAKALEAATGRGLP